MRPSILRSAFRASIPKASPQASRPLSRSIVTSTRPTRPRQPQTPSHLFLQSPLAARSYSTPADSAVQAPDYLNPAELSIFNKIAGALQPTKLEVQDISGGCGSMYALDIVSAKFKGMSVIKQHRLVNEVLEQEIKGWHGVQLKTRAP